MLVVASLLLHTALSSSVACFVALQNDLQQGLNVLNGTSDNLEALKAAVFSARSPNDLGHYESCLDLLNRKFILIQTQGEPHPILYGLCAPAECTPSDIQTLLDSDESSQGAPYEPKAMYPANYPLGLGGGLMVLLLCLLFCFVVVGSYADFTFEQQKAEDKPETLDIPLETLSHSSNYAPLVESPEISEMQSLSAQMLLLKSFSLFSNMKKLTETGNADPEMNSLHAVKCMSLAWVVLANVYLFRFYGPTINPEDVGAVAGHWTTAIAYGGVFATDTFLWVSAFLLTNMFLKRVSTTGRVDYLKTLLHRALRYLPLILFSLLFFSLVIPAIGYGPLWHRIDTLTEDCGSYWWTDLLFIGNFLPGGTGNHCLTIAWYFALDIQFLAILPLFLIIYVKFPNTISWVFWIANLGLSVLVTSSVASYYNFKVAYIARENYHHDLLLNLYAKPYCRISAYILGAYCGATYFAVKVGETEDFLMRKIINGLKNWRLGAPISFLIGLSTITFVIFIQKEVYDDWEGGFAGWTDSGNESFLGFEHLIFALGLSFLLLPVLVGEAKWVKAVLNLQFWQPLGKLGICVLFAHLAVARALFAGEQRAYYWQKTAIFRDFVLVLALSYAFGLLLYLHVEAPVRSLLKPYISN